MHHDANTFIETRKLSRAFGLAYRTLCRFDWQASQQGRDGGRSFPRICWSKYGICRREKIFIAPMARARTAGGMRGGPKFHSSGSEGLLYVLLLGSSAKHKNVHVILEQARGFDAAGIDIVVVGGHRAFFPRMRPIVSEPTFITPAMSATTIWPLSTRARYVWHFPPRPRASEFRRLEAMARGLPGCLLECSKPHRGMVAMRSLTWIRTTAMAGGTRSLVWQETRIFARQWRRKAESERRCSPGNAARSFTSMKSCVYPLSPRQNYLPQISHAREAQIARLMCER